MCFDRIKDQEYYRAFPALFKCMYRKASQKDLLEFDAWGFCRQGQQLSSVDTQLNFPRIESDPAFQSYSVETWTISGQTNQDGDCSLWLRGRFSATFACVVCNKPALYDMEFDRHIVLKKSEEEADAVDDESLDENTDVLACSGTISLIDWLEDELILSCPLFAKHEKCRQGQDKAHQKLDLADRQVDTAADQTQKKQRPFAGLGELLKLGKK